MPHPIDLNSYIEARRRLPEPSRRRALRVDAGLSRELVARHIGVTQQTVMLWERGDSEPRGRNLLAYLEVLDQLSDVGASKRAGES